MSPVVRISPSTKQGWSSLTVSERFGEDLYRYLRSLQLSTKPVQEIGCSFRFDADEDGKTKVVKENLESTFEIQAYPESLVPVVGKWFRGR